MFSNVVFAMIVFILLLSPVQLLSWIQAQIHGLLLCQRLPGVRNKVRYSFYFQHCPLWLMVNTKYLQANGGNYCSTGRN
jgi:hypothetical protein